MRGRRGGRITVKGVGYFPNIKRPRIVWAGVESDVDIRGIAADLRRGLREAGLPFDDKPFSPHITVGRVRGEPDLQALLRRYRTEEFGSVLCGDIRVMKSNLGTGGAEHSVVHVSYLEGRERYENALRRRSMS